MHHDFLDFPVKNADFPSGFADVSMGFCWPSIARRHKDPAASRHRGAVALGRSARRSFPTRSHRGAIWDRWDQLMGDLAILPSFTDDVYWLRIVNS